MQKNILFFLVGICSCLYLSAQSLLQKHVGESDIEHIVSGIGDWRQHIDILWREKVQGLPDDSKQKLVKEAEKANGYEWPSMKAMTYLDYKLNGNRTNYERENSERRATLNKLMVGELVERKGRFIPQIINGLWLVLEESTWVSPAHLPTQKLGIGLPHIEDPYIDLGAGRQALDVALAYFLFKNEFDKVSKHINIRILYELNRRILDPYLERDDYWWMAIKNEGTFVNNWNIWINTNVLKTFLLIEKDESKLRQGIQKVMRSSDYFIDYFPEDGICEEGPSYWMHSGGELGNMLRWLTRVSADKISFIHEAKIKNIGAYIMHTHIIGDHYVNFADANAIERVAPTKVWNYGELYQDENFKKFAAFLHKQNNSEIPNSSISEFLEMVTIYQDLNETNANYSKTLSHFYPSMGLVTLNSNNPKGNLFFASIGGYNDVSHNHNDVGSFMLYLDSIPLLIDVGVGTYNAKTFSSSRYEIWNMQSQWHNLPIINGVQQKNGKKYKARSIHFEPQKDRYLYSLDISEAYPEAAKVKSWVRSFDFKMNQNIIQIAETYDLETFVQQPEVIFVTALEPLVEGNKVSLAIGGAQVMSMTFTKGVQLEKEEVSVEDMRIQKVWGQRLYRVKVKLTSKKLKDTLKYTISTQSP